MQKEGLDKNKIVKQALFQNINISSAGLFYGGIGICMYLSETNSDQAIPILKDTLKISRQLNIDFRRGLTGFVISLQHLKNKGIFNGDINLLINDTDTLLFRTIAFDNKESLTITEIVEFIYYEIWRLENIESDEEKYLHIELIKTMTDILFFSVTPEALLEPKHYSLEYKLPQILWILSRVYHCEIYQSRITKMLEMLSPLILFKMPILHANRLTIMWALKRLINECNLGAKWQEYLELLKHNIDVNIILNKEVANSIYIENGVSSIYYILKDLPEINCQDDNFRDRILNIIGNSTEMKLLETNEAYLRNHIGLYNGYSGVALTKHIIEKENG